MEVIFCYQTGGLITGVLRNERGRGVISGTS